MKKKNIIISAVVIIMILGGITVGFLNQPISEQNNSLETKEKTIREKQLDYLKDHEKEMTEFIKSLYPTVESVQFDWDSMEVAQEGNGLPQGGDWLIRINGKFNHWENTEFTMAFGLDTKESLPSTERMGFITPLYIYRDGGWYDY
ncbi:hypothetical protein [Streptococcus marimammalium]